MTSHVYGCINSEESPTTQLYHCMQLMFTFLDALLDRNDDDFYVINKFPPKFSCITHTLTFTTLFTNSADDKLLMVFLFFPENKLWHIFMQIISLWDNLHEMSEPISAKKKNKKKKKLSSAGFTQHAMR